MKVTPEAAQDFLRRYEAGESAYAIGKAMRYSYHTVIDTLIKAGVPYEGRVKAGVTPRVADNLEQAVKLRNEGSNAYQIAAVLGVSPSRVRQLLKQAVALGIRPRSDEQIRQEAQAKRFQRVARMLSEGATGAEIAKAEGLNVNSVWTLMNDARVWAQKEGVPYTKAAPGRPVSRERRSEVKAGPEVQGAWGFIVGRVVQAYGHEPVARELGVKAPDVHAWCDGERAPNAKQQEALWVLLCAAVMGGTGMDGHGLEDLHERMARVAGKVYGDTWRLG